MYYLTILCKHMFYFQAKLSNQIYFTIFHLLVLTTMLDGRQVVPYHTMIHKPIYPSWIPQNTRPACTPGTSKTNPSLSYQGVQVPIQTWTLSPHSWVLDLVWRLDLHHPRLQLVGPERARTHDKRATSLPALISKYVLRIISLSGRSSIDTGGTNATRASLGYLTKSKSKSKVWSHPVSNYYPYIFHVIVTIIYFLSLASDMQSLDFYRSPVA